MDAEKLAPTGLERASYSGDDFMSSEDVAVILGLSPRTLERFRLEGRGPTYFKFGRIVRYKRSTILTWADAQLRTSTSDPGRAAANSQF